MNTEAANRPLNDLEIDMPSISNLLVNLGFDLSDELAPAYILGATDILVAVNFAMTLPAAASFDRAIECCQTLAGDQPEMVRRAQKAVLYAVMSSTELPPLAASRAASLDSRIN